MEKKKICWITSACFMETDFNYSVMTELAKYFKIHWFVLGSRNNYISESKLDIFKKLPDFHIEWNTKKYRMRDFRSLIYYYGLYTNIKFISPDIVYCNVAPDPFFSIISLFLDRNKTIFAAHDGKAQNDSSSFGFMRTLAYNILFKHSKYVNMFSQSQANLMKMTYPQNEIYIMPLPLKDFGKSVKAAPKDFVRFLSFGNIIYQKNIDLLIDAAEILYERGYHNFKVSINGTCKDWEFYASRIKHPTIFECNPHFISNEDLLVLFATSHYSVFPYRRVSQSGVLKLAFNYNLPVITSCLGAFREEVVDGVNGFFFEAENVNSLADVMKKCLLMHQEDYAILKKKMKDYIEDKYSTKRIVLYYTELFTNFIK